MSKKKVEEVKPPIAPGKVEVTNQNALRLIAGMSDIMIQQNKIIINLLGAINNNTAKPVTDLGGADAKNENDK